jgi:hypothetical protein
MHGDLDKFRGRRMVLAGKVFRLREDLPLPEIAAKLKDFRREEAYDEDAFHASMVTEVKGLSLNGDTLQGIFSQDLIGYVSHHGERMPTPRTLETSFAFVRRGERVMLLVMERKFLANNIANKLSEVLFVTSGYITEASIPPEVLKSFHEQNPDDSKVVFFDDVDIPNVSKLSLYGSGLMNTALYNDYLSHGKIWYIVMTSKKSGNIVGITRNAAVTIFNRVDKANFLRYVVDEVFPLIK